MIPALQLQGISKHFGPVRALDGADFVLEPGEVHALLGENGAGKSTLMNIAAGIVTPDRGEVLVRGSALKTGSPRDAAQHRIGMVHQHFSSVSAFNAVENIALAARWPMRSYRAVRQRAEVLVRRTGLDIDLDTPAESLSVLHRQRIEILKVLAAESTILLFDEPTGTLAPPDARELLEVLRRLADAGSSVALITHRLDEALAHADRVTVLRRGKSVFTGAARDLTPVELARHMLGKAPEEVSHLSRPKPAPVPAVQVRRLTVPAYLGRGPGLNDATLEIVAGEVVGVAAVDGNGQFELLRSLAGLLKPASGTLEVADPVAFIPEDRTIEGLIQEFSLADNLLLGFGIRAPWVRRGVISPAICERATRDLIAAYDIRTASPRSPAATLSGGNQQRFMLARALSQRPRVLIAEQPARGLDLQAAGAIYRRLQDAAADGTAVLIHSSDLDELLAWCDRLVVLSGGRLRAAPLGSSRDEIGRMMLESSRGAA